MNLAMAPTLLWVMIRDRVWSPSEIQNGIFRINDSDLMDKKNEITSNDHERTGRIKGINIRLQTLESENKQQDQTECRKKLQHLLSS